MTDAAASAGRLVSRRVVLSGMLGGTALAALGLVGPFGGVAPAAAGQSPVDPVTALVQAYLSTLVPGPADDPLGGPGAVEAGGVEELLAQAPYVVPLLVADLTAAALVAHGTDFVSLDYPEREALVVDAFADSIRSVYHLIALAVGAGAFYADFRSRVGSTWMGLPGPADSYLDTFTDRTGHGQPQRDAIPA
ncbi:MAG: hypothetical protein M3Z03_09405 [Actinomycetota bacterium]|nr:hypothetical protein [Actinomycetota bacterium]